VAGSYAAVGRGCCREGWGQLWGIERWLCINTPPAKLPPKKNQQKEANAPSCFLIIF